MRGPVQPTKSGVLSPTDPQARSIRFRAAEAWARTVLNGTSFIAS